MKVYAISDLHLSINNPKPMNIFGPAWDGYLETIEESWSKINDDDLVLIAGDISWAMLLKDSEPDLQYIGKLKGKKVIIRGNHDYWWKSISAVRQLLPETMYAVQNDAIKIGDVIICGSRLWTTPELGRKQSDDDKRIYDREYLRLKMSLDMATKLRENDEKIVVMTHYPPFNSRFTSTVFTQLISQYGVSSVVYGHLHGKESRVEKNVMIDGVNYILTSCDLVGNQLIEIL